MERNNYERQQRRAMKGKGIRTGRHSSKVKAEGMDNT